MLTGASPALRAEQRVNVIIDLTSPPQLWQALGDGYRVETGIIIFNTPDTLKVPVSALFRKDGQWQVFVISAGRARLRKVEISRQNASEAMEPAVCGGENRLSYIQGMA